MKKWIHSTTESETNYIPIDIVSFVFVDDVEDYNPRDAEVFASQLINYNDLTKEKLMQLSENERSRIHDIRVLRKLDYDDLTVQQQREVTQANQENFKNTVREVKDVVKQLQNCRKVYIAGNKPGSKNRSFYDKIWDMGGELTDKDVTNIVHQLHVKDYSYSTLSYLDWDWNNLLMVFEYKGPYTFKAREEGMNDVTVESLDVYVKIDVNENTRRGYAALSFHDPEFKLSHPYADYPIDKE